MKRLLLVLVVLLLCVFVYSVFVYDRHEIHEFCKRSEAYQVLLQPFLLFNFPLLQPQLYDLCPECAQKIYKLIEMLKKGRVE